MDPNMKVTSIMVMLMVEVDWFIQMEKYMKENGTWIKLMDMVFTYIKMEQRMKVAGRKTYRKAKA